ncbi:MAG: hypothetical protein A2Y58_05350 [Chloroflexi bacterium RBG_13_51_52]|nr:MAG: hypothetical protein A2Y58_05350 [Chloroflexi bacterium RBG_13_51_52]
MIRQDKFKVLSLKHILLISLMTSLIISSCGGCGEISDKTTPLLTTPESETQCGWIYRGTEQERGVVVIVSRDNGYIIVSKIPFSDECDCNYLGVSKIDGKGDLVWKKIIEIETYCPTTLHGTVIERNDGTIYLTTLCVDPNTQEECVPYEIVMDQQGNIISTARIEGSLALVDYGDANYQIRTTEGEYISLRGSTMSPGLELCPMIIKHDINKYFQWQKVLGEADDGFYGIKQTSDNGYIIAGQSGNLTGDHADACLIKTDMNGEIEWRKNYGGEKNDIATSVIIAPDGGYIFVGWTCSYGNGSGDVYMVKIDESGNEEWSRTFGDSNSEGGFYILRKTNGQYVIAGSTCAADGDNDILLIITDSEGNCAIE